MVEIETRRCKICGEKLKQNKDDALFYCLGCNDELNSKRGGKRW